MFNVGVGAMKFTKMRVSESEKVHIFNRGIALTDDLIKEYVNSNGAHCLRDEGEIVGIVCIRKRGRVVAIERIHAASPEMYRVLLMSVLYLVENSSDEITAVYPARDVEIEKSLYSLGFFANKDTTNLGKLGVCSMFKIMRESTWREGTHYPSGELVIDEVFSGESRVMGVGE